MTKGIIFLLTAALLFSFSIVFAKFITVQSNISALEITFCRFLTGFLIILAYVVIKKKPLRPNRPGYVTFRGISNFAAASLFFLGIQFTTVTKANMLNMTYPVFVFVMAPYINREKARIFNYLFLFTTMIGIYLVTLPDFTAINIGDLYALISSVISGISTSLLREARKYDETYLILFYLMLIGTLANFILIAPIFIFPEQRILPYLLFSALSGFLGQLFSTIGFRYLNAPTGSLITASRMLFAGILGVSIFADPVTLRIILGGLLILISLIGVSGVVTRPRPRVSLFS